MRLFIACGLVVIALVFAAQKRMECRGKGGVLVHWTCIDRNVVK